MRCFWGNKEEGFLMATLLKRKGVFRMKKNWFSIIAVVVCFSILLYSHVWGADKIVIRWGDVLSSAHPAVKMIEMNGQKVLQKTNGQIEIQAYPGGQLGGSRDMIEAVANGMQEMVTEGAANFGQWVPSIGVIEAPYIWRGIDHLNKVMNGPLGEDFNKQLIEKRGMRILGTTYYGVRQLTTTNKMVKSVSDMANFKLRVPENEVFMAMAKAWGAKPTPINFNELWLALKQNVVDGEENPLPTIDSGKFYEVQKYLVLTAHILTPRLVVVNENFWKKVPAPEQKILKDTIMEGIQWNNEQILAKEKELLDRFKSLGMIIVEPNVEEFRKAVLDTVPKQFEAKWGKDTWEKIQAAK
jgi:tripartite ATP-independent transporter DctP family solute receptor